MRRIIIAIATIIALSIPATPLSFASSHPDRIPPEPPGIPARICNSNADCPRSFYCRKTSCNGTGICALRPRYCTMEYRPVCGCDGKTYSNACVAAMHGQNTAHYGPCEGTPADNGTDNETPSPVSLKVDVNGNCISVKWKVPPDTVASYLLVTSHPGMRPIGTLDIRGLNHLRACIPPGLIDCFNLAVIAVPPAGPITGSEVKSVCLFHKPRPEPLEEKQEAINQ